MSVVHSFKHSSSPCSRLLGLHTPATQDACEVSSVLKLSLCLPHHPDLLLLCSLCSCHILAHLLRNKIIEQADVWKV